MTDDMSAADLELMPNVQKLLVRKGTTFTNAVDSFPLCCPARATFITGQYAHNHGVVGNFAPYGWYGMKDRRTRCRPGSTTRATRTALIGKWLNGYGARDAHGEVPKGFDIWRGLLDVSAYDYFNFVMNIDGKLKTWGDAEFAMNLVKFAIIEVDDQPDSLAFDLRQARGALRPAALQLLGRRERRRTTRPTSPARSPSDLVRTERKSDDPFFIWWAPAAPHREDVATTLMGRPGPDPRPAPRYAERSKQYTLPQPPNFNEADTSDKSANFQDKAPPLTEEQIAQLQLDYQGRIGSLLAVDDHVAKLVKTLRQTDQLDNTTIMFLSDNGWMQGEHRIPGDKFLPYEESLRVPLVIRGPGVPKGQTIDGQVANIDFAPTLVDIANATAGRTMDGISLLPTIQNPKRLAERAIETRGAARRSSSATSPSTAGTGRTRGCAPTATPTSSGPTTGETELYDRKIDPYQLVNHSGRSRVRRHRAASGGEAPQAGRLQGRRVQRQALSVAAAFALVAACRGGREAGRRRRPPQRPLLRDPRAQGIASRRPCPGLEHDRLQRLPGGEVGRDRRRRARSGARGHRGDQERAAPLPHGCRDGRGRGNAHIRRTEDAQGRDDPDPQRRRARADAVHRRGRSSAHNTWTWNAGRRVFELLAPDGSTYVMQSYSQIRDPGLTLGQLPALGARLELPQGWSYRSRRLKRDLTLTANGTATIIQDDLTNTYQRLPDTRETERHRVDVVGTTRDGRLAGARNAARRGHDRRPAVRIRSRRARRHARQRPVRPGRSRSTPRTGAAFGTVDMTYVITGNGDRLQRRSRVHRWDR